MAFDLFELEVSEGATGDIGGSAEEAVAEAPVEAAVEADAQEQATPVNPLEGVDLDALRALSEIAQAQLARQAQPAAQQQQEPQGPPEFDPLDPDSMQNYFAWRDEQLLGQIRSMVDPISEHAQAQQAAEQQSLLKDAARDVEVRKGEFLGDDPAREIAREQMLSEARALYPEFSNRYGNTDRAAELALEAAHARVKGYQDAIAKQAVEQHVNRNTRLAEQHSEPGGGGGSAVATRPEGIYKPGELSLKYGGTASALRQNAA